MITSPFIIFYKVIFEYSVSNSFFNFVLISVEKIIVKEIDNQILYLIWQIKLCNEKVLKLLKLINYYFICVYYELIYYEYIYLIKYALIYILFEDI